MKKDTMLLIGAALIIYFLMKGAKDKRQATAIAPVDAVDVEKAAEQMEQVTYAKDQTVNFVQPVPSPAMIVDIPKRNDQGYDRCDSCNRYDDNRSVAGLPFIC